MTLPDRSPTRPPARSEDSGRSATPGRGLTTRHAWDEQQSSRRPEVLPRVEIEVRRQDPALTDLRGVAARRAGRTIDDAGDLPWRVYPRGEDRALTERGRLLGGRFDQACRDAERLARENGFFFVRPLLLPGDL